MILNNSILNKITDCGLSNIIPLHSDLGVTGSLEIYNNIKIIHSISINLLNNMKRNRRKNIKIITSNFDSVLKKNELAGKVILVNCCGLNFLCVCCVLKGIFRH